MIKEMKLNDIEKKITNERFNLITQEINPSDRLEAIKKKEEKRRL
jgi:hypothetical protein